MLPHHVGVDIPGIHRKIFSQQIPQTGGIQGGAGAQHPPGIEAGQGAGHPGHDVHRIGGHQEDPVEPGLRHRIDDGLEHPGVALKQVQPGLSRLLRHTGADDHNVRVGAIPVVAGVYFHMGAGKGQAVVQIHGLPLRPLPVNVKKHQLVAGILIQQGVGVAHAHHTSADKDHFTVIVHPVSLLFYTALFSPLSGKLSPRAVFFLPEGSSGTHAASSAADIGPPINIAFRTKAAFPCESEAAGTVPAGASSAAR